MAAYDLEAVDYDRTRGGLPRAVAAAEAMAALLPRAPAVVLDLAVGTGIVAAELAGRGHRVVGVDLSRGMLAVAAGRLPGAVAAADARALPVRTGAVDAVTAVWLLHLLDDAEPVLAEAVRVLRPGGVFVTTVDKRAAHAVAMNARPAAAGADSVAALCALAGPRGLRLSAAASFIGYGQAEPGGRDPVYPVLAFAKTGGRSGL